MTNYFENAVKLRRELHQRPELGWGEFCTTARIAEELESLGWKIRLGTEQISQDAVMGRSEAFVAKNLERARREGVSEALLTRMQGYTGCIAEWNTGRPGPVTGLRFDIDCVGVAETTDSEHRPNALGFRSRYEGAMHSCGHDGHTAIGLTIARWVAENSDQLKGTVKLIFQPAEEGVRGAAAQAASGQLDNIDGSFFISGESRGKPEGPKTGKFPPFSMKQKLARGLRRAQEVFPQPVQAEDADFHLIR